MVSRKQSSCNVGSRLTQHHPSNDLSQAVSLEEIGSSFNPWQGLRKQDYFFENAETSALVQRGLFYARAGVPIHFQGTAGRGKTAIALQIANRLGRPVNIMTGNEWMGIEDLVGKQVGQSTSSLIDKYVQRVRRSEATLRYDWENAILADAMLLGHTLVYDEFTRSSARANGILLSVLEEGVLVATNRLAGGDQIQAHPDFRIILTSNPHDYAGVNASPDALLDRMVTFPMAHFSADTEAGIVAARTGLPSELSLQIVQLVRELTKSERGCSMRASILIGQISALRLRSSTLSNALLAQIVSDVLYGRGSAVSTAQIANLLSLAEQTKAAS